MRLMTLATLLVAGCGSGADATTGDGGGDSPDLAAAGADGGGGARDLAAAPTRSGSIFVQSYSAMQPSGAAVVGGSASAGFNATPGGGCARQVLGACELDSCAAGTSPAASAGTVTVSGGSLTPSLVPLADKTYPAFSTTQSIFAGGETLTFAAAGADVPAFSGSLTAPSKVQITSPAKPPSASPYLVVDRTHDFALSWSGGGSGLVQVALDGGPSRSITLYCRFPAAAGTGAIPAAALAMIPSGQGGFSMAAIADAQVTAGDWSVDLSAYFNAVWPDNTIVSGPSKYP
jgi:hypothetical protein